MSGRDCLAHASFAACLSAERALIGCCSMDGKGAWRDNVLVERFWRTIKYDEVYLRAYGESGRLGALTAWTLQRFAHDAHQPVADPTCPVPAG